MQPTITHLRKNSDGKIIEIGFAETISEKQLEALFPDFDIEAFKESNAPLVILKSTTA